MKRGNLNIINPMLGQIPINKIVKGTTVIWVRSV